MIYQQYIKWNQYKVQTDQLVHGSAYYVESNQIPKMQFEINLLGREKRGKIYQVRFDEQRKLFCSCSLLITRGFPCRHIWKVCCYLEYDDLSAINVTPRWTINYGNHLKKALGVVDNKLIERIERITFSEEEEKLDENQRTQFIESDISDKKVKSSEESENSEQVRKKGRKRKENPVSVMEGSKAARTRSQIAAKLSSTKID